MLDWCRITMSCYRARGGKPALTLPCPAPPKPGVIHHAAINFWPFWGWEKKTYFDQQTTCEKVLPNTDNSLWLTVIWDILERRESDTCLYPSSISWFICHHCLNFSELK